MNTFEKRVENYVQETNMDSQIMEQYDMKIREIQGLMTMMNVGDLASVGTTLLLTCRYAFAKGYRAGRKDGKTKRE